MFEGYHPSHEFSRRLTRDLPIITSRGTSDQQHLLPQENDNVIGARWRAVRRCFSSICRDLDLVVANDIVRCWQPTDNAARRSSPGLDDRHLIRFAGLLGANPFLSQPGAAFSLRFLYFLSRRSVILRAQSIYSSEASFTSRSCSQVRRPFAICSARYSGTTVRVKALAHVGGCSSHADASCRVRKSTVRICSATRYLRCTKVSVRAAGRLIIWINNRGVDRGLSHFSAWPRKISRTRMVPGWSINTHDESRVIRKRTSD